jgi:hypothetical protein
VLASAQKVPYPEGMTIRILLLFISIIALGGCFEKEKMEPVFVNQSPEEEASEEQ